MKKNDRWIAAFLAGLLLAGAGLAEGAFSGKDSFTLEPLRDPFWPIGYFPKGWKSDPVNSKVSDSMSGSDWDAPAAKIRISGTSWMGDQTVAIINGDLKEVGDLIAVEHNGRTYQWILRGVKSNGKVSLERAGVSSPEVGFQAGDK